MNKKLNKIIVKHLRGLADRSISPLKPEYGLCSEILPLNIYNHINFKKYPGYTGDSIYPITDPESEETPVLVYFSNPNKWEGSYGEERRKLCGWCADQLENRGYLGRFYYYVRSLFNT